MNRNRRTLLLTALAAALAACATPKQRPFRALAVAVGGNAESGCRFEVDGRTLTLEEFQALAARWPARPREAHLSAAGSDTPYRCLAGAIELLRRARFRRIGFLSEPAPE